MGWLMSLLDRLRGHPQVDPATVRDEMTRTDPAFRRVRDVQHDALNALASKRGADQMAIQRERQFWEHVGQ